VVKNDNNELIRQSQGRECAWTIENLLLQPIRISHYLSLTKC